MPAGLMSPAEPLPRLMLGRDRVSVIRSAAPSRRLSRVVNTLVRLMKLVPDESIWPSGPGAPVVLLTTSRSSVRSMEPVAGNDRPAYNGLAPDAYRGEVGSVRPCRGRSTATTTKPLSANESATASMSVRLRVIPCSKMSTGQPPAGLVAPAAEFALGTVTTTGLKRVRKWLPGSRGDALPCQ